MRLYLCRMLQNNTWEDTIVAIATAPGVGAIAVMRLSGAKAIELVDAMFASKELKDAAANSLHVGWLRQGEELIDEVVVSIFKAPHSYTGEDVVEVSTHGSTQVQEKVLRAFISNGARIAKAGEFTQRAFLNGKMDLTQAESVADLINSSNDAQQKASLHNLKGGFKNDLIAIREQLIEFSALMELELDFAEEDVEFADRSKFNELLNFATKKVQGLIASFAMGNVIINGIKVAIVGKPNAGKSTLLNVLLNEDRAIVSSIAGTTRDTIEESININGIQFLFIDTAGIRSQSTDEIELIGMEKSFAKIEQADVVLLLTDKPEEEQEIIQQLKHKKYLVVVNKIDINETPNRNTDYYYISAKQQQGISMLTEALYAMAMQGVLSQEDTIITNTRHLQHLQEIEKHLLSISQNMQLQLSTDLIAPDIKLCLQSIGELTGTITNEHVLDYVFSKFCIGK